MDELLDPKRAANAATVPSRARRVRNLDFLVVLISVFYMLRIGLEM